MKSLRATFAKIVFVAVATACSFAASAATTDRAATEKAFQVWIGSTLWPKAKAAGVSRATFDKAFAGVTLGWDLPELVPPGTNPPQVVEAQAEFRSPAAYFDEGRLKLQALQGRAQIAKWGKVLATIETRYGVPRGIVVAIWARETGFGRAVLPEPAIRTLATHAFMGRRKDLFERELVAALQILEAGDITAERMKSSWAGALGQPQFLPSYFLKYAVDFDGDGRRDIWNSVPDTLASIANFLRQEGWNGDRGWGVEASVPKSVACTLEGPDQGKGMAEWAALGVTQVDGSPLPGVDLNRESFLLMPGGRFGPSFIVSGNFYVLKVYNYSDLYALYVGHLADRFSGNRPFAGKWGQIGGYSRSDVAKMQKALEAEGYDVGGTDGLVGYKTRIAVGLWQAKNGIAPTCFPDAAMVRSIH